jgi:hypothetical protein
MSTAILVKYYGPTGIRFGSRFLVKSANPLGRAWIDYDPAARDAFEQAAREYARRKGLEITGEVDISNLDRSFKNCRLFLAKEAGNEA